MAEKTHAVKRMTCGHCLNSVSKTTAGLPRTAHPCPPQEATSMPSNDITASIGNPL